MGAQGSQGGLAFKKESVWGVNPTGQLTGVNFVSESLSYNIKNEASKHIRPDRQTSDIVQVGAETGGGLESEFQSENIDFLIPSFLYDDNEGWRSGPANDSLTFTAESTTGAGGEISFSSINTSTLDVGQLFHVEGSTSNDGWYCVKEIVNSDDILVTAPLVTESSTSCTLGGEWAYNGVTSSSWTIERANYDISQFFTYTGMVPNKIEFGIESGAAVSVKQDFIGKSETLSQSSPNTPAPTTLKTAPVMNAVSSVGRVSVDDAALASCLLQSTSIVLDNKVEGKEGVGVLGFCFAVAKSLMVTGDIALYFNDETYYEKYINSETFSLMFEFTDSFSNKYAIHLPNCKFDEVTSNISGKDDDVMLEGSYEAFVDPVIQYTIAISRLLA